MKEQLTARQIVLLYLFISITPILTSVPNIAAYIGGNSGYMSILYSFVLLMIFTGFIVNILSAYPGKNLYGIIEEMSTAIIAKIFAILYGLWALMVVNLKINQYLAMLQSTLLPTIRSGVLLLILFFILSYVLIKGPKTLFRFAEISYVIIIFFLGILTLFAIPTIELSNLVPVTETNLYDNLWGIQYVCGIGGNIMLILFFAHRIAKNNTIATIKGKLYMAAAVFSLISFVATLISIGNHGGNLTSKFAYPIFQTVKSMTILSTFERFDSFITLVCVFSDIVSIGIFLFISDESFTYAFNQRKWIPVTIGFLFVICCYVGFRDITQFQLTQYYYSKMIYINLIFQYVVPLLLGVLCIGKMSKKKIT